MYCNQCGKYIANDSLYCNYCGEPQNLECLIFEDKHCDVCKKDLPDNSKFCNYCGIRLSKQEKQ